MIGKKKLVVQYNIEQIYLEIARSAAQCGFVTLYKKPHEAKDINFENNTRFSGVAISIAFSYAAMEAFCNAHLHSIYNQVRGLTDAGKKAGWAYKFRNEEDKQHFSDDKAFDALLWKELKDKLKILASALHIPSIEKTDKPLWLEICSVSRDLRNFIIHPDPRTKRFDSDMKKIMEKNIAGKYANIATKTIRHFYEKRRPSVSIPAWLDKNVLFRFLSSMDIERAWNHKPL